MKIKAMTLFNARIRSRTQPPPCPPCDSRSLPRSGPPISGFWHLLFPLSPRTFGAPRTSSLSAVLWIAGLVGCGVILGSGCKHKSETGSAANNLATPTELAASTDVDFAVAPNLTNSSIYYSFVNRGVPGKGVLVVESAGKIVRELPYEVLDSETLRFLDGKGGPKIWDDKTKFTGEEVRRFFELSQPPEKLRVTASPDEGSKSNLEGVLYLYGMCQLDGSDQAIPIVRTEETNRVPLPFDETALDASLETTGPVEVQLQDGPWNALSSRRFKEPVHPKGAIRSLKIGGRVVEMKSANIRDGMIVTKDFGEIEVLYDGVEPDLGATRSQIRKIRDWLATK